MRTFPPCIWPALALACTPAAPVDTETASPGGTACGVVDGRIYVLGGEGNPADPDGMFAEVEAYDAASDTWTSLAPMPTPRHGMAAATWEGQIYVPGGADEEAFGAVDTHEVLTP